MEKVTIIKFLKCVKCSGSNLSYKKRELSQWNKNIELSDNDIECDGCSERYPVTADDIPVMWTKEIKNLLENRGEKSAIKANNEIYDKMSQQYMNYTRKDEKLKNRIVLATKRIIRARKNEGRNEIVHLDYGCGPGHVLEWISDYSNTKIGLDVSLENLRNARKSTGAMVVLGDAGRMPFKDGIFDIVTESSVLHHIENWRGALGEACRVCSDGGGVLIDSEPSKNQMNLSCIAKKIFDSRWHVYHLLSYVSSDKHMFRDIGFAKKNYWEAEIHNQPGKGFDPEEVKDILEKNGMNTELFMSPNEHLESKVDCSWKHIVLQITSMQNPWDPKNSSFMILGYAKRSSK